MNEVIFTDPETYATVHEKKKPITLKSKYFAPTTDMSFYDGILQYPKYHKANKGLKGTIRMISPDQYFIESGKSRIKPIMAFEEKRIIFNPHVEQYFKRAKQGEKMPIPVIDVVHHTQEGRHRAMVAKQLGLKKIPVLFVEEAK
jgi:hypothetical protein